MTSAGSLHRTRRIISLICASCSRAVLLIKVGCLCVCSARGGSGGPERGRARVAVDAPGGDSEARRRAASSPPLRGKDMTGAE